MTEVERLLLDSNKTAFGLPRPTADESIPKSEERHQQHTSDGYRQTPGSARNSHTQGNPGIQQSMIVVSVHPPATSFAQPGILLPNALPLPNGRG